MEGEKMLSRFRSRRRHRGSLAVYAVVTPMAAQG